MKTYMEKLIILLTLAMLGLSNKKIKEQSICEISIFLACHIIWNFLEMLFF